MSDIDASHIVEHIDSIETIVHYRKKDIPVRAPLFGRYQLLNILPLFEIASLLHIPEDLLLNTLNTFSV